MEPFVLSLYKKIDHIMRRLEIVLLLYGENITLNIKILVLIVSNHLHEKVIRKLSLIRHLFWSVGKGEEFANYPWELIRETFQKLNLQVQKKTRRLISNLSEWLLKMHGTHYRVKVKLEMQCIFIWCIC